MVNIGFVYSFNTGDKTQIDFNKLGIALLVVHHMMCSCDSIDADDGSNQSKEKERKEAIFPAHDR